MVQQINSSAVQGRKTCFACELCAFSYDDEQLARKCEEWCLKNKSCNFDIIRKSVGLANMSKSKE